MADTAGPRIYNLFPLMAGPFPAWRAHFERARAMGFDWIFINPVQLSGYSGSLYAIKDYYAIDPRLAAENAGSAPEQFAAMTESAARAGLKLMMIGFAKSIKPDALFFAETLGCPFEQALENAASGFDFIFNSSKWWDFQEPWCLDQYRQVARICRSVSFRESRISRPAAAPIQHHARWSPQWSESCTRGRSEWRRSR
jgi:hypothetical protein